MGCDGGTIPRRDELVRMKKKPEQKDKEAELSFKWRNCALSQQLLQEPIVACALGRLYSKSSILEALLDKANKPESINHIKNLKDVKDLNLTKNPAYVNAERSDSTFDDRSAPYICPIIGLEMTGKFRFIFIWSCGCVFSERALKEVKQSICHKCQTPFNNDDIIVLNGTEEDIKQLKCKLAARNANRKSTKKVKIEKADPATPECSKAKVNDSIEAQAEPGTSAIVKTEEDIVPLALPNAKGKHPPPRGHFGSSKRAHPKELVEDPSYKKSKKDYSVASDPKSSEVYKSLFTSHKSEKEQTRAHWVTYNPFYN